MLQMPVNTLFNASQVASLQQAAEGLSSFSLARLTRGGQEAGFGYLLSDVYASGILGHDPLLREAGQIVDFAKQGQLEEASVRLKTLTQGIQQNLKDQNERLVEVIKQELLNPSFNEDRRRTGDSIVNEDYRDILDPFVTGGYPLNAFGTFCRVIPDFLESYVNIGTFLKRLESKAVNEELRKLLELAKQNDAEYARLRLAVREAIHAIGDLSYNFEWNDPRTYKNIDTLLEGLARYQLLNSQSVKQLEPRLIEMFAQQSEIRVLDLGSGVGGTGIELFYFLEELRESGKIPRSYKEKLHVVLIDVSKLQLDEAANQLEKRFGFSNIRKVVSNFSDIPTTLDEYRGKIDVAISGAALCHVTRKKSFFKELFSILRTGGVLNFWDPAVSAHQGDFIRLSPDGQKRIHYGFKDAEGEKEYIVGKGGLLPVATVRMLADKEYTTTVELPIDEIVISSAEAVYMHLGQMGYYHPNISAELEGELKKRLQRDILEGVKSAPGFNLLQWYRDHLMNDSGVPQLPKDQTTPYDLIEAVSDEEEYQTALTEAGFENYRAVRHRQPVPYDSDLDSVLTIIMYFYGEKAGKAVSADGVQTISRFPPTNLDEEQPSEGILKELEERCAST